MKEKIFTVFGDSITKGVKLENGKPKLLETNAVEIIAKHFNANVVNNSFFGQTLKRIYEKKIIDNYITKLDKTKENIAVISLGGNDADYNWLDVAKTPNEVHFSKTKEDEFEAILTSIIKQLKSNKIEVWIVGIPPVNSEKYFKNVISLTADKTSILEFYKGDISNIERHQELYNMILFKVANKEKCVFLDIRSPFLMIHDFPSVYCEDGVHPNIQGQTIIAQQIIKILETKKDKPKNNINQENIL